MFLRTLTRKRYYVPLMVVVAVGALAMVHSTDTYRRFRDDLIWGNRYHYLSCDELPTFETVESVLAENEATVQEIEAVSPGFIMVWAGSGECPGRGYVQIAYDTRDSKRAIEEIIDGQTFLGIPFSMNNT